MMLMVAALVATARATPTTMSPTLPTLAPASVAPTTASPVITAPIFGSPVTVEYDAEVVALCSTGTNMAVLLVDGRTFRYDHGDYEPSDSIGNLTIELGDDQEVYGDFGGSACDAIGIVVYNTTDETTEFSFYANESLQFTTTLTSYGVSDLHNITVTIDDLDPLGNIGYFAFRADDSYIHIMTTNKRLDLPEGQAMVESVITDSDPTSSIHGSVYREDNTHHYSFTAPKDNGGEILTVLLHDGGVNDDDATTLSATPVDFPASILDLVFDVSTAIVRGFCGPKAPVVEFPDNGTYCIPSCDPNETHFVCDPESAILIEDNETIVSVVPFISDYSPLYISEDGEGTQYLKVRIEQTIGTATLPTSGVPLVAGYMRDDGELASDYIAAIAYDSQAVVYTLETPAPTGPPSAAPSPASTPPAAPPPTVASPPPAPPSTSSSSGGLSVGAIVGIAIGSVVAVGVGGYVAYTSYSNPPPSGGNTGATYHSLMEDTSF